MVKKGIKIVTIGGGSTYTPELIEGFIDRYESLPVKEIWLVDIEEGREKLEIVGNLAKRMIEKSKLPIDLHLTLDRKEALKDADFVTTQIRVGQLDARILDERIPNELGLIGQETNGAGGMFKAFRTIPVILDIIRDMEKLCPNAWLINFSNPAGINTEASIHYGNWEKSIGLCNVPIGMKMGIADLLDSNVDDIDLKIFGLNHHFFVTDVIQNSKSMLNEVIERYAKSDEKSLLTMKNIMGEKFSVELLRGLNAIPNSYFTYYFRRKEKLEAQLEDFKNHNVRAEKVKRIEKDLLEKYKNPDLNYKPKELEQRGGAYYSVAACSLINSIYNDKKDIQYVNVLNNGAYDNFDKNNVLETACTITSKGPIPIKNGNASYKLLGTVNNIKAFEKMVVEAAVTGNRDLAIAALTLNPLIPSEKLAIEVFDKLLEAHKRYLPQFK